MVPFSSGKILGASSSQQLLQALHRGPPCFDLSAKTSSGAGCEDEWSEFVSAEPAPTAAADTVEERHVSLGSTPRSASPTGSRCSEAATSTSSAGRSHSRRTSNDSISCGSCHTPLSWGQGSVTPPSHSGSGTGGASGTTSWARGMRAMWADYSAKQRVAVEVEAARIAQEEAEAAAARAHEAAVMALMRSGATRPQAEAVARRRLSEGERLGNRSLRRLPRQAQEIEGEKVQEGVSAAALRRELALVAHQASLFGGFR
ncbi:hypothetical protein HYH02_013890 [Chlamydomonas schloesseri]|uniref:Uncharacterized protein n=1 Tax=Chlamydomonas schloesseri TaxID=2026947 RepID=A0A835SMX3_9CHLO|nr:hypothetical protein HYH02_013890 [Chlamydomonas schloesseri]|eukprot:KAG2429939.1 hypothetical protein HYH02_013890 [Chlamydomonas schloesseri]